MEVRAEVLIDAPREKVWKVISDIENSVSVISGIERITVLEQADNGLVGLKWEEERTMFGQTATEVMWITEAEDNKYYQTRAERPNVVYISKLALEDDSGKTRLSMEFGAEISSLGTKILSAITGIFFKKATQNALQQDLEDIKIAVEGS
jgi:uncharacterized membrane protein